MKYIGVAAALLIFGSLQLFGQDTSEAISKFDPGRSPAADLQNVIAEAQKTNKNILLDVGGEWCIWCHRIDAFIEGHEEIHKFLLDNYIIMKVNFSPENKNEEFLSKFPQIPGYPHFFVLNKDGVLLHSQDTGKLEQGKDYNPEKFMAFLKQWATGKN
ncbi:MAG TPA: thioredoxin family protein [Ignavibacteriaceae bacterium]|nr:thioredoxin family protein [Ignavibacteriaceae bacterium]